MPRASVIGYRAAPDGDGQGAILLAVVLYRRAPYQVELFCGAVESDLHSFAQHRHPNVDSIEYYLCGDVRFTVNGVRVLSDEALASTNDEGEHRATGASVFVRSKDWHGAAVGKGGGAFLSFQKWKDGVEPSSVGLDWEGPAHLGVVR